MVQRLQKTFLGIQANRLISLGLQPGYNGMPRLPTRAIWE